MKKDKLFIVLDIDALVNSEDELIPYAEEATTALLNCGHFLYVAIYNRNIENHEFIKRIYSMDGKTMPTGVTPYLVSHRPIPFFRGWLNVLKDIDELLTEDAALKLRQEFDRLEKESKAKAKTN